MTEDKPALGSKLLESSSASHGHQGVCSVERSWQWPRLPQAVQVGGPNTLECRQIQSIWGRKSRTFGESLVESGPLGGHTGKGHWVKKEGTVQEEDTVVKGRVLFSQDKEKPLRFSGGAVRGRPGDL